MPCCFLPHLTDRRRCWQLSARRMLTLPCWSCPPLRRRRPRMRWLCWSERRTDWCNSSNSRWGGECMIEVSQQFREPHRDYTHSWYFHLSFLHVSHTEYVNQWGIECRDLVSHHIFFNFGKTVTVTICVCYHQAHCKGTCQVPVNYVPCGLSVTLGSFF